MANERTHFNSKAEVLAYFRQRAKEIVTDLEKSVGRENQSKMTSGLQSELKQSRNLLIKVVEQTAKSEKWSAQRLVETSLLVYHGANVVMIDFRNQIWLYDYMSFSRRVGELWEGFCGLCFHYTTRDDFRIEIPPLFADVKKKLHTELYTYINELPLEPKQKSELQEYYKKIWLLVDAGQIQLELDMHICVGETHYNIDFKSGFGSNEKGNTNRLLVVASIYKNIVGGSFQNLILVRSREEEGNHYLKALKRSGLWEVLCDVDAYAKIGELTGVPLTDWIKSNIKWEEDLSEKTAEHLKNNGLMKYLVW